MSRIRDQTLVSAVNEQVRLPKHSLTDQHLIAEDKCFFYRLSPMDTDRDRFGHIDRLLAAISVFHDALTPRHQAKLLDNMWGKN